MRVVQKSGWSPFPGGYQRLMAEFPSNESVAVDKSLWDWTMPSWVIFAYVCLKQDQMVDPEDDYYWRAVWARLYVSFGPGALIREPNGVAWRQTYWGLMKSGSFLTLSLNSDAQQSQHLLAWGRFAPDEEPPYLWAMGDDMLVRTSLDAEQLEGYTRALEGTGCLVKKIEYSREFCGFLFVSDDDVRPLYPGKHRHILAHVEDRNLEDTVLSYELLYAMSPERWFDPAGMVDRPLLSLARLWARGLVKLEAVREVPGWANY